MQVGGGGVEFLTEKKCSAKKCFWGPKTQKKKSFFSLLIFFFKNVPGVPGVLKRVLKFFGGGGGGFWGVWGAPRPHPGSRGVGKQYTSSYDHDM